MLWGGDFEVKRFFFDYTDKSPFLCPKLRKTMEELLCVFVANDGEISVTSDFDFGKSNRIDREDPFYRRLVEALSRSDSACLQAIRLLERARRDARRLSPGLHPELENALVLWRREKTGELRVPPYYVLHQRTLLNIADLAPANREELLAVPGFGPGLYARYGEEILALIRQFAPAEHENAGDGASAAEKALKAHEIGLPGASGPEKRLKKHENTGNGASTARKVLEAHENTANGAYEEDAL